MPPALGRVWMPAAIGEPLTTVGFTDTSVYDQLQATGIVVTGGDETVRAVVPSHAEHAALGLTPSSAAFSVRRIATSQSQGVAIECRHTLIRGDLFCLTNPMTVPVGRDRDESGPTPPLALAPTVG
ncbi:Transcriptional regulator, GntR family [Blastococcus saxobsidens DD2]|uniref:Transcriptional regulator, GntR family n=1 Tax=Blastococcus saxobsidens (strain DD2) TaxID=1146883 RepID=H6RME9_BLASD|nr:Transcriptional regulator, GntR family [Blastococcus saxobsidens DD2]